MIENPAAVESENQQLLCTIGTLIEGGSVAALRAKDWANFARRYNGPNYAINNYDVRLSAAYQKFSYGGTPDLRIRMAQTYLTYLGWHPGARRRHRRQTDSGCDESLSGKRAPGHHHGAGR